MFKKIMNGTALGLTVINVINFILKYIYALFCITQTI